MNLRLNAVAFAAAALTSLIIFIIFVALASCLGMLLAGSATLALIVCHD